MPKRRKAPRTSSSDSAGRFSPTQSQRESRNDYQVAGPSCAMHVSHNAPKKPVFRGPETDVLRDLVKDKLKNIRVQMIRADLHQNDSFRQAYVVDDTVANRSKGKKTDQHVDDQQLSCFNSTWINYNNGDKNYGMDHSVSPTRVMSRDRSISPQSNISRPPSPPLPYSPKQDHFNSDNILYRDRPERKSHERPLRDFTDQHTMNNFSSNPPEPRSPDMYRIRSGDHNKHQKMDEPISSESRSRFSRSPPRYFRNNHSFKSPSPNNCSFSPNHGQLSISQPPLSPPLRDHPPYSNDRSKRRRSSPRRNRSRDRRRRHISPRKRTSPRSPMNHRDHSRKRPNKNQEGRKGATKDRKRRSQSNPKSRSQDQQPSFQQPQPIYPHGVVGLPPPSRPFPPMMIPLRPPPFPSLGAWRPRRPPPSGWPYPRPRPFYFPY